LHEAESVSAGLPGSRIRSRFAWNSRSRTIGRPTR
jgi:hypothetical protein